MRTEIVKVVCDTCGKEVLNPEGRAYMTGHSPLEGWITLHGPVRTHLSGRGTPRKDFCSMNCLRQNILED